MRDRTGVIEIGRKSLACVGVAVMNGVEQFTLAGIHACISMELFRLKIHRLLGSNFILRVLYRHYFSCCTFLSVFKVAFCQLFLLNNCM